MTRLTTLAALTTALAGTLVAADGQACGGCFHNPAVTESTVVTGHRMALSVSPTQAVLWDQIRYDGNPSEFSWVLPIKPGARVEVASDAFFEVLEAGTATSVRQPPEGCVNTFGGGSGDGSDGFGCGNSLEDAAFAPASEGGTSTGGSPTQGANGVTVVHEGTVGPYDTVTLSAETPNALADWLAANEYELPDEIAPIVDAYVEEGFDFIALKLSPGEGVRTMKPVRVVSPGGGYALPLRMVAAGVGSSVDLVLHVIGEGRYQAGSEFANTEILPNLLTWDFLTDRSNYAEQRLVALNGNEGRTWMTTYARRDPFFSIIADGFGQVGYTTANNFNFADNLAGAMFLQAADLGELDESLAVDCQSRAQALRGQMGVVTDLCDDAGTDCRPPTGNEIDRRELVCEGIDDLAVALTGLHPGDVYLTRMEAKLPPELLDRDLVIEAADEQREVAHRFTAGLRANACWDQQPQDAGLFPLGGDKGPKAPLPPGGMATLVLGGAALWLLQRRRRTTTSAL